MNYRDKNKAQEIKTEVAWKLLDGPEFLKSQYRIGDNDLLEPILLIRDLTEKDGSLPSSFSVYTDRHQSNTGKQLNPIARMAVWDKENDDLSNKTYKLPKIDIVQHELSSIEQSSLHTLLVELDKCISEIEYEPDGLFPSQDLQVAPFHSMFSNSISLKRTGLKQKVEFSLSSMINNSEIEKQITNIIMYIKKVCRRPMDVNYKEAYRTNPFSLFDQQGDWFYKPNKLK